MRVMLADVHDAVDAGDYVSAAVPFVFLHVRLGSCQTLN